MKFRKKPIVIEAEQFFPDKPHPKGVEQFVARKTETENGIKNTWYGWRVQTLEGPLAVSPGDWVITGIKGERYPCKPDIFDATYEPVPESEELNGK